MHLDSTELLEKAKDRYVKKHGRIDVSVIAEKTNLSYSTIYNPLFRGRKPNACIWLKIMAGLDGLEAAGRQIRIKR